MKTKSAKVLPKTTGEILNGGVYAQAVRCGKPNCKCARGETHTAYYFLTRRAGKLIKFYVPRSEVENLTALVEQSAAVRRCRRQAVKSSADLLGRLRTTLRDNAQLLSLLRSE